MSFICNAKEKWSFSGGEIMERPTTNEEKECFEKHWLPLYPRIQPSKDCGSGKIITRTFTVTYNNKGDEKKTYVVTLEQRDINEKGGKINLPKCLIYFGRNENSSKSVVYLNDNTNIKDMYSVLYQCSSSKLSKKLDREIQKMTSVLNKIDQKRSNHRINQNLNRTLTNQLLQNAKKARENLDKKDGAEHFGCFIRKFIVTTSEQRKTFAEYEHKKERPIEEEYLRGRLKIRKNLRESVRVAKEEAKEAKFLRGIFGKSYR